MAVWRQNYKNTEADWVELKRSELLLQRKSAFETSLLLFIVPIGYLPFYCEALYRYHLIWSLQVFSSNMSVIIYMLHSNKYSLGKESTCPWCRVCKTNSGKNSQVELQKITLNWKGEDQKEVKIEHVWGRKQFHSSPSPLSIWNLLISHKSSVTYLL